jgi:hypothetical protein
MRSAYPAVVFCALACASVPSSARLSSGTSGLAAASVPVSSDVANGRGTFLTGTFTTYYYGGETLLDALRRRAPLYLRPRPNPTGDLTGRSDPLAVYINGSFSGSVDVLQLIPAFEVFSVDRISASEAAVKFGPKHSSGALLVTLVRHD